MNKTLRVPFCLLLLLFGASTLLPEGASKAATRRLSKSQKLKGGFGKPEVITGTIAKALPGFRAEIAAIRLRRREQTEFHDAYWFALVVISKPRQVRKRHAAGMDMHTSESTAR